MPDSFESFDSYFETWAPLHLRELKAELINSLLTYETCYLLVAPCSFSCYLLLAPFLEVRLAELISCAATLLVSQVRCNLSAVAGAHAADGCAVRGCGGGRDGGYPHALGD